MLIGGSQLRPRRRPGALLYLQLTAARLDSLLKTYAIICGFSVSEKLWLYLIQVTVMANTQTANTRRLKNSKTNNK